jgi:succinate dehydrogenase / fumarate reductase, cytochrome b subunit
MPQLTGKKRPQFTNIHVTQLAAYRLPLAGIVSILHRISGALLFLIGLPFMLYLFDNSLSSELSYESYRAIVSHWFAKLVLLVLVWGYLHHFCAGIRYLLLDMHLGLEKQQSHNSAVSVMVVALVLTFLIGLKIFGAFN